MRCTISWARGSLRLSIRLRLPRLYHWKPLLVPGTTLPVRRNGSPSSDSILTTSAPRSARNWPITGPATIWQNSSTRMPSKGPVAIARHSRPLRRLVASEGRTPRALAHNVYALEHI